MGPNIVMSDQPIVVPLSLRDSDFDGVSDYDELYVLGTNPMLWIPIRIDSLMVVT
jgi:hypothetical protein